MILLLPLHRPKQVYMTFTKKMIPKMKQQIYNAVYPDILAFMCMPFFVCVLMSLLHGAIGWSVIILVTCLLLKRLIIKADNNRADR